MSFSRLLCQTAKANAPLRDATAAAIDAIRRRDIAEGNTSADPEKRLADHFATDVATIQRLRAGPVQAPVEQKAARRSTAFGDLHFPARSNRSIQLAKERLCEVIEAFGIARVMRMTGAGKSTVYEWSKHKTRLPALDALIGLAGGSGVSLDWLAGCNMPESRYSRLYESPTSTWEALRERIAVRLGSLDDEVRALADGVLPPPDQIEEEVIAYYGRRLDRLEAIKTFLENSARGDEERRRKAALKLEREFSDSDHALPKTISRRPSKMKMVGRASR